METLEDVYPDVSGLETAFVGFCGGFDGRQDCAHISAAGLKAVCVDRDPARLAGMPDLYSADWEFVEADVYEEAKRRHQLGERYDLVSLDPYTSQFQECVDALNVWTTIATRKIVMGTGRDTWVPLQYDGWVHTDHIQRSSFAGGVYWSVLEKSA